MVCRQLGRGSSGTAVPNSAFGPGKGAIVKYACKGGEAQLSQCTRTTAPTACPTHSHDVGVLCSSPGSKVLPAINLRLVGGTDSTNGRLEIQYGGGAWGTVRWWDGGWPGGGGGGGS